MQSPSPYAESPRETNEIGLEASRLWYSCAHSRGAATFCVAKTAVIAAMVRFQPLAKG